jgi:RNA-directed DNA polymerase
MDFHIYQKLMQWSLRRHPAKGKKWVVNKYFHNHNGKSWVFAAPVIRKGKTELYPIQWLTNIKITRYAKIKHDANPYDTDWIGYFEERETRLMLNSAKSKKTIKFLWDRQERICPFCRQKITSATPWRVVKTTIDGKQERMLAHLYCGRKNVLTDKLEDYEPVSE